MKGLSNLYASLLAYLTIRAIAAATSPRSTNTLEDGLKINKSYILNNTTNLNASNLTYAN